METNNKRTCLYDSHVALGAQISPFGGFDMPIQYSDIISEHNAVRHNRCGFRKICAAHIYKRCKHHDDR